MLDITLMYASERFSTAVGAMATSTESLRKRLEQAWIHDLSLILMHNLSKLPSEIQSGLSKLSKTLHNGELGTLNDSQIHDAILEVVSLNDEISRAHALGGPMS